jgi:hypothetical protein
VYVNENMIPVETVPGIRGRTIKEIHGTCEFNYDVFSTLQEPLQMP